MKRMSLAAVFFGLVIVGMVHSVYGQGLMDLMPSQSRGDDDVLSSKVLKQYLPKRLAGYKRGGVRYQDASDMGLTAAYAETSYKQERERITVRINDMGGVGGLAQMPVRGAGEAYKKITVSGYAGLTHYEADDASGFLEIYIGGRFIIELKGRRLKSHQSLYRIAESIDCDGLAAYITQK